MSLKFVFVTILYQFVISEQKTAEKIAIDPKQVVELQNLLEQLEIQIGKEHKAHKHLEKQKGKEIIEGNDVLNLLQKDHYDDKAWSKESELKYKGDRDCKFGRCGCSRGRCGEGRAASSSNEVTKLLDSLEKTIDNDIESNLVRCGNGRCGDDGDGKSDLRCRRGKCGRNKVDFDDREDGGLSLRDGQDIKQELETYGKTFKLNKEVNAIVLKAENVDKAINELNKHCQYANCKVIDYSQTRTNEDLDEDDNINAVMLDLTPLLDNNNLAKKLNNVMVKTAQSDEAQQNHLTADDLHKYFQDYKKTTLNNILNYIKDKNGRRESLKKLSSKQKQLVENIRSLLLKGGIGLNDKEVMKQIENILFGEHSSTKIYPHNERSRNIYVPKNLYERVGRPRKQSDLRAQKRLLPLTLKQRNKLQQKPMHLWRRTSGSGYGVPFHFLVQGLGQAVL